MTMELIYGASLALIVGGGSAYCWAYSAPSRPVAPQPVFTRNGLQTLLVIAALFAVPMVIEACAGDWLRLWVKPWLQPDAFLSLLAAAAVLVPAAALACAVLYGLYRFATGSIFGAIVAAGVVLYGIGIIH
jgi:hypothetical protein